MARRAVLPPADPRAPFRHGARLTALAGFSLVLLATGRRVLRAFAVEPDNLWETAALSFGLGYGPGERFFSWPASPACGRTRFFSPR